jgi:hypothetical protein
MSVAFVTKGKFLPRTGTGTVGGGAPMRMQEEVKPRLLITDVEYKKKNKKVDELITINITDVE